MAGEGDAARVRDLPETWSTWTPTVASSHLVFVDGSGSSMSMTRSHARTRWGTRTSEAIPRNRRTATTILGEFTLSGRVATLTPEGRTLGDLYAAVLVDVRRPHPKPRDLVVMDDAGAHKEPPVPKTPATVGARPVDLPPYSPDLNPIEVACSKLKAILRTAQARSVNTLTTVIAFAIQMISPEDAARRFRPFGY